MTTELAYYPLICEFSGNEVLESETEIKFFPGELTSVLYRT